MTVRLQDAKIRVTLDPADAKRQLDDLEKNVQRVDNSRKNLDQKERDKAEEESKKKRVELENKNKATTSRFGIDIQRPITGFIPAASIIEAAGPVLRGVVNAAVDQYIAKEGEEGGKLNAVTRKIVDIVLAPIGGISDLITKTRSAEESLQPAVESTLRVAKSAALSGSSAIGASEVLNLFEEELAIQNFENSLKRRGRKEALELFGKAAVDVFKNTRKGSP